jgi:hypothetical protein
MLSVDVDQSSLSYVHRQHGDLGHDDRGWVGVGMGVVLIVLGGWGGLFILLDRASRLE